MLKKLIVSIIIVVIAILTIIGVVQSNKNQTEITYCSITYTLENFLVGAPVYSTANTLSSIVYLARSGTKLVATGIGDEWTSVITPEEFGFIKTRNCSFERVQLDKIAYLPAIFKRSR